MKTITLVVLVSTASCELNGISESEFTTASYPTMEECQAAASVLDKDLQTRAFCIPEDQN